MQRRTKAIIISGVAAAAVTAGLGSAAVAARAGDPPAEPRSEAAYTDAHRSEAGVSQSAAEAIARDVRPGAVVDSHLESEGQGLRWEVKTDDGTRVWEVQIDP